MLTDPDDLLTQLSSDLGLSDFMDQVHFLLMTSHFIKTYLPLNDIFCHVSLLGYLIMMGRPVKLWM